MPLFFKGLGQNNGSKYAEGRQSKDCQHDQRTHEHMDLRGKVTVKSYCIKCGMEW